VRTIFLVPLGNTDRRFVDELRSPLEQIFKAAVETREFPFEIEEFYDGHRNQFNSTGILLRMKRQFLPLVSTDPDHIKSARLLAVMSQDLFIPILTYVFGEAELGGRVAVVSYHRLENQRYGLPSDGNLLITRLCKEAIHELGHAFGLVHCPSHACVMHTSNYVEDIDLKGSEFCDYCRRQLAID
jgi:archaemetzincin